MDMRILRFVIAGLLLFVCSASLCAQDASEEDEETSAQYLHGIESKLTFDEQMLRDFQTYALKKGVLHKSAPEQTKSKEEEQPVEEMPNPKKEVRPIDELPPESDAQPVDEQTQAKDKADQDKAYKILRQRYMLFAFLLVLAALYYGNKLRTFGKEEDDPYHHGEGRKPRSLMSYVLPLGVVVVLLTVDLHACFQLVQSHEVKKVKAPKVVKVDNHKIPGLHVIKTTNSKYYGQTDEKTNFRQGLGYERSEGMGNDYYGYWKKSTRHGLGRTYWTEKYYHIGEYVNNQAEGCGVSRKGTEMWYGRIETQVLRSGYGIHYWTDTKTIELAGYAGWHTQQILSLPDPKASKGGKTRYMRATYKFGDDIYITLPHENIDINEFICQCLVNAQQAERGVAALDSAMADFPGYKPLASFNRIRLTERLIKAFSKGM